MKWYHRLFFLVFIPVCISNIGCFGCDPVEEPEPEPEIPRATLIYPYNTNLNLISRSPVFIWDGHLEDDEDGSFEFTLEIAKDYDAAGPQYFAGTDTFFQIPDTLDAGGHYRWWVITEASGGREVESYKGFFNVSTGFNNPPARVTYIYPPENSEEIPVDTVLSWYCFDPDGDDLSYDLWHKREHDSDTTFVPGLTVTEYSIPLETDTRYMWDITVFDDNGGKTVNRTVEFSTVGGPEGVFADLTLTRKQTKSGIELVVIDNIWARFDETYAPQWALRPLQPPSVSCEEYELVWQESRFRYYYENAHTLTFLVPGTSYEFSVAQGNGVPALTESIIFPLCAPLITSPAAFDPVSLDGFTVTWSGYDDFTDCDRQVSIAILDIMGDSTGVYVTTENDGSYTFTAGELSVIDPSIMDMQIVLVIENVMNIDSPGYDPRSWIRARTLTVQTVYAE